MEFQPYARPHRQQGRAGWWEAKAVCRAVLQFRGTSDPAHPANPQCDDRGSGLTPALRCVTTYNSLRHSGALPGDLVAVHCPRPSWCRNICALRPVSAGVIPAGWKGRFGFHNFRHSLATALVKLKVDPKTVQGVLRHEDFGTTMELYAQSDMESMRDAQGKFLEQLMGDRIHLLTERVQ